MVVLPFGPKAAHRHRHGGHERHYVS
jgi:hypothetical protein